MRSLHFDFSLRHLWPILYLLACALNPAFSSAQQVAPVASIDAERVRALALASLAEEGSATGIVVGWMEGDAPKFVSVGVERKDGAPVASRTHFEIGSITKALTGSLLAVLQRRGTVLLTDPVGKWVKELEGSACGKIRLEQLATHTSGLPRMPSMVSIFDGLKGDPYRTFTPEQVIADCAKWKPDSSAPPKSEYSNYGFGLLGLVLERATQTPYETLIRREISAPIGIGEMDVTFSHVDADSPLMAQGYGMTGRPVSYWHIKGLHAAGAAVTSPETLLRIAYAAQRQIPPFDAGAAKVRVRDPNALGAPPASEDMVANPLLVEGLSPRNSLGLGWVTNAAHNDWIVWHNGGTGGFRSMLAYSRVTGRSMVAIANGHNDLTSMVLHLLNEKHDAKPKKSDLFSNSVFAGIFYFATAFVLLHISAMAYLTRRLRTGEPMAQKALHRIKKELPITRLELAIKALTIFGVLLIFLMFKSWPLSALRFGFGAIGCAALFTFIRNWQPQIDERTATKRRLKICLSFLWLLVIGFLLVTFGF
jgi:serine-type D-Ala-D-Ala carboxypeptidase/endopeptidase